jgi:ubiquitin-activating enzyme E1
MNNTEDINIDDHRYSRQSYSIGQDVMCKLSKAKVLVIGYSTLSLEIIKNLALLGISKVDIYDTNKLEKYQQTGMYYPYNKTLPLGDFAKLNPTINIGTVNIFDEDKELDKKVLKGYNVVICTNSLIDDGININRICHKFSIPFIMMGCYGLMGYVFNDWGEKYTINDVDGEIYENLFVESIEGNIMKFKDFHNLSDGDVLIVTYVNSDQVTRTEELKVNKTKTPLIIELKTVPEQTVLVFKNIIKKKIPKDIEFKQLKKSIQNPQVSDMIMADYSVGFTRSMDLHELHIAYSNYMEKYGETPRAWSNVDFELFTQYIKSWDTKTPEFKLLAKKFCFTLRGDLLPIASIIGAVGTHEVLKVLGHKYNPIHQWYYMDYYELIEDKEIIELKTSQSKKHKSSSKYEGIINIFGKDLLERIQKSRPFIIGSGAIGCELLKNLGMMGVKQIYLTDMDYIEKSNLSRQFLFNDNDIRKSKAQTAAKKIKLMNPDTNVCVFEQKVCKETEDIFNSDFHSNVDIYMNALDNQDARLYVDQQAIKYSKPLIDSGTTGAKGNVQVVVPHLTESYGSAKDPDDTKNIPICTIKSFPFKQAHTIQWARELFETEFNEIPCKIHKYFNDGNLSTCTPTEISTFIKQIYKYRNFTLDHTGFHSVLSHIWVENFDYGIKELLKKYEDVDKKNEIEGKVLPTVYDYSKNSGRIVEFMEHGFNILSQMFSTNIKYSPNISPLLTLEACDIDYEKIIEVCDIEFANKLINKLNGLIKKVDFEKDDDDLGHVQWLLVSSNLRNHQYKIDEADLFTTRKISGNIIPAMITTTALVSGFQILEYIKLIKFYKPNNYNSKDIDYYKNRFVNLNTNYIDGITPAKVTTYKIGPKDFSLWDKIIVNTNNVKEILDYVYKTTGQNISYMMYGNQVVYDGEEIFVKEVDLDKMNMVSLIEELEMEIPIYLNH